MLGASVHGIVLLLTRDFVKIVFIACLVAGPLVYVAMNRWLQGFAYRIDQSLGTFVLAGVLALAIALATVGYQAVKAALANPVKSLRNE